MQARYLRRLFLIAALVAVVLLLQACSADVPQNTFATDGEVAHKQRDLLVLTLWPAIAIFIVVEGLLVFAVIWFRQRRGQVLPKQIHGHTHLEIGWTIAPTALLLGLAVPMIISIFDLADTPDPAEALEVNVIGHQWWWEFEYPQLGVVTANEAHIPVGQKVLFHVTSKDVIHSFWVPRLGGKIDAVPGRDNQFWLKADEPGNYAGQCAELCGISHANMRFRVIAQTNQDFQAWVEAQKRPAEQPAGGNAAEGAKFFSTIVQGQGSQCSACHTINGVPLAQGKIGPDLTHVASRDTFAGSLFPLNAQNLTKWLNDPKALKPGALMPVCAEGVDRPAKDCLIRLTEQDIANLVAYLETLK